MTGQKNAPSTYDRMMAEIDMSGSDEEEDTEVTVRKLPGSAFAAPHRAEGKGIVREVVQCDATQNRQDGEFKANKSMKSGRTDNAQDKECADEPSPPRRHVSSFPPAPRKTSSRRSSKSLNSEAAGHEDSEDDSDKEKETRVRHHDLDDGFGAKATATRVSAMDQPLEMNAMRSFLTRAPKAGIPTVRCYVQRDRSGLNRLHPVYRLFLEENEQFLLSAQKRSSNKTSNYLLTMERTPSNRRSPMAIAKLRANWSGSEYTIFDDGLSPSKTALDSSTRGILGFIEFAYDEMGPGRLNVRIPAVQENGAATKWKDPGEDMEMQRVLEKTALLLRNKRPQYDAPSGGHVLDFKGRVTMPSIKNFQMQSDAHGDDTVLQFGRVSCQPPGPREQCKCHKDRFTMDLRHPLSPVQAFAICLAVLDSKVADGKIFESVTKLLQRTKA